MPSLRTAVILAIALKIAIFAQDPAKTIGQLMQDANKIRVFNGNVLVGYRGKVVYEGSFGYADASLQ